MVFGGLVSLPFLMPDVKFWWPLVILVNAPFWKEAVSVECLSCSVPPCGETFSLAAKPCIWSSSFLAVPFLPDIFSLLPWEEEEVSQRRDVRMGRSWI